MSSSRGLRNNNPGNIRKGEKWQGMAAVQSDKDFVIFKSMDYGYRAMCKLLRNYYTKYKLDTVRKIISRWAPANENHTDAYIRTVCKRMAVSADDKLVLDRGPQLAQLMAAISFVENGVEPRMCEVTAGIILANMA